MNFGRAGSTLYSAFAEALSYLKKFNQDGIKKIPSSICIATFETKKYWLIDLNKHKEQLEYIYSEEISNVSPSKTNPISFEGKDQTWTDPKDLVKKVRSNVFLKTKINKINFANINDYFYKNTDPKNQDPKFLIRDLVIGSDVDYCIKKSGYDKNSKDYQEKINKLSAKLKELNKSKKVLDWVEPIFITDMQEIIAEKWDHVGGSQSRKDRGAFFTPDKYSKKMQQYLNNFVNECKKDSVNYLIIDRCAGSGNLEKGLSTEILKNTILNTFEFCEWVHLGYIFGNKVKYLKPPYSTAKLADLYVEENLMQSGDALSKEFNIWLSEQIKNFRINNPNGRILFYENPPFRDETANSHGKGHAVTNNYVIETAIKDGFSKQQIRDLSTQFIYSAKKLMRKEDQYCLISPIKYWKWNYLNFDFIEGFLSNRKEYNASSEGGLPIIRWKEGKNINDVIELENNITLSQIRNRVNKFDVESDKENYYAILSIGNMCVPHGNILTNTDNGLSNRKIYVSNKNILKVAVLNCLNAWVGENYLKDNLTIMKSADNQEKAFSDKKFLNDCLLWTLLSEKTRCFSDEDKQNEICLDGKAAEMLDKNLFDETCNDLIKKWKKIINNVESGNWKSFFPQYKYGFKQIKDDFLKEDIKEIDKFGKTITRFEDDGLLYSEICIFRDSLREFYRKNIENKLFEYELLK
ncbi:hypothetical protein [Mycoplasmopsis fermentans]|uniref:hypothetical protein n=1 Tax=Mycoplasmopsis fermentans TaxID=2115 RepID=UPI0001E32F19|nr:hypothetical protein [Mycoplasmopsis fermentans]ADN68686.1 conserved hypothetical protein [Mycoplasmopsis fermentans JER]